MTRQYILNGHTPVPCDDLLEWGRAFESMDRIVAQDHIPQLKTTVSTVFLGLDHQWNSGPPLLFETMIFGGPKDGYQRRYSTWAEAEVGHAKALEMVSFGGTLDEED